MVRVAITMPTERESPKQPCLRTLAKARISGSLSCIRPAVSINTTSNLLSRAENNK